MGKEQYLQDELDKKILDFKNYSNKHKRMHRRFRYSAFFLTGILSVLAGLALYYPEKSSTLNIIILFVSALAGSLTSLEGLRKSDELWIHERTIYYTLSDLKRELDYELESNNDEKLLNEYFNKFQVILTNAGENWNSRIVRGSNHDNKE